MLHDMKIVDVLGEMNESLFDFWGTGSRFASRKTSGDFDFFTSDSHDVVQFLKRIGFRCNGKGYNDSLVHTVMAHPIGIHVQLTIDVELKKKVRNFIAASNMEYSVPKEGRRALWNMVIKGLEAQERSSTPRPWIDTYEHEQDLGEVSVLREMFDPPCSY